MTHTLNMRRRPKPRLPHLPAIHEVEPITFSRREIAEMFGNIDPSIISRDAAAIGLPEYEQIDLDGVWKLYVLACYKRVRPCASRVSFVEMCTQQGDAAALEFVELAGGSEADCRELVANYLAKKQTKPLII